MLFLFLLIIYIYFLIPAVITRSLNHTVQLVIPTEIPTKEAIAEMKIYPVNVETKIIKCSI